MPEQVSKPGSRATAGPTAVRPRWWQRRSPEPGGPPEAWRHTSFAAVTDEQVRWMCRTAMAGREVFELAPAYYRLSGLAEGAPADAARAAVTDGETVSPVGPPYDQQARAVFGRLADIAGRRCVAPHSGAAVRLGGICLSGWPRGVLSLVPRVRVPIGEPQQLCGYRVAGLQA